ncbi:MAG: hypothetical protein AAGJ97_05450, partial [Planctomycetota bacterium]
PALPQAVVDDFAAFALGWVLLEIVSRHVLYEVVLDVDELDATLIAAARAAVDGAGESAVREGIEGAFALLGDSRDVVLPVECDLLELRPVPSAGGGWAADDVVSAAGPACCWFSTDGDWEAVRDSCGPFFTALCDADRTTNVVAGRPAAAGPSAAGPTISVAEAYERASRTHADLFGEAPAVWVPRRRDVGPLVPSLLTAHGAGLVLAPQLDRDLGPPHDRGAIRWGGPSGPTVPTFGAEPIDAADPAGWLDLPPRLAQGVEVDDPAAVLFVRGPGPVARWYEIYRRLSGRVALLGTFVAPDAFVERAAETLRRDRPKPSAYPTRTLRRDAAGGRPDSVSQPASAARDAIGRAADASFRAVIGLVATDRADALNGDSLDAVASRVGGPGRCVVFNPLPFDRSCLVDVSDVDERALARSVVTQSDRAGRRWAKCELPAGGFRVLGREKADGGGRLTRSAPLAVLTADASAVLRNESFEVTVLARTGGIGGVRRYGRRERRVSQRLGLRGRDVEMVCEEIAVAATGPLFGEVVSSGRLVEGDRTPARFRQTFRLARGSRVLSLKVEIEDGEDGPVTGDPRTGAVVSRLAWADASAPVRVATQGLFSGVGNGDVASSVALHVDDDLEGGLTFLPRGLPYHRRIGDRVLETVLVVAGETCREFSMAIAVDAGNAARVAASDSVPPILRTVPASAASDPPGSGPSAAWLWRLDGAPGVTVVRATATAEGRLRFELLESSGRPSRANMRFCRTPRFGALIEPDGRVRRRLEVADDALPFEIRGHELVAVEVAFEDDGDPDVTEQEGEG